MHEIGTEERTYMTGVFPFIKAGKREELAMICNQLGISNHANAETEWVKTDVINDAVYWEGNPVKYEVIPDVRGMTLRDAIYVLENLGLEVQVKGRGRVSTQSRTPGGRIAKGSTIKLQLS